MGNPVAVNRDTSKWTYEISQEDIDEVDRLLPPTPLAKCRIPWLTVALAYVCNEHNQTRAYLYAYPNSGISNASVRGSDLLEHQWVRQAVSLLENKKKIKGGNVTLLTNSVDIVDNPNELVQTKLKYLTKTLRKYDIVL